MQLELRKLEHHLSKFESKQGIMKANVLRLSLLPFLRNTHHGKLLSEADSCKVSVLASYVFLKWWKALLFALNDKSHTISISDKPAFLECISQIISRDEWRCNVKKSEYQTLLSETLELAISRLNAKTVSLPVSAFVGKVFAYSFWHLPHVGVALLFLLSVKQNMLEGVLKRKKEHQSDESLAIDISFPPHLKCLVDFKGRQMCSRSQKKFINCMTPPQAQVPGIGEPRGLWVRRWASFDSDVFCSFLRHYLCLVSNAMADVHRFNHQSTISDLPGMSIILAHVYHHLDYIACVVWGKNSEKQVPVSLCKVFTCLRDFLLNNNDRELAMGPFVVKAFDGVLKNFAISISANDSEKCNLILLTAYEFMLHVSRGTSFAIDWYFWLTCVRKMLSTQNVNCELLAFSMLFNVWEMLPSHLTNSAPPLWVSNSQESVKWNASMWLIGCWDTYFTHWQPSVRLYYMKLVVWRILEDESVCRGVKSRLKQDFEQLNSMLEETPSIDMRPCPPVLNRKQVIVPCTGAEELIFQPHTRRTHAYEVFDDAVYICAQSASAPTAKQGVIATTLESALNFFKKPKDEERPVTIPKASSTTSFASTLSSTLSFGQSTASSFSSIADLSLASLDDERLNHVESDVPSDFVRRTPQVARPTYRFQLVPDETHIRQQLSVMNGGALENPPPPLPRLPFETADDDDEGLLIMKPRELPMRSKILGKALNEWERSLQEFESFTGDCVPLLKSEFPSKINGA